MNAKTSSRDQAFSAKSSDRRVNSISMVARVLVALLVAVAITAAFLYHRQQAWAEIVGKDVIRTTAPLKAIAEARDTVIRKHQNLIEGKDGKQSDPTYRSESRSWSIGSSPKDIRVKVTRGRTQISDANAERLSIESILVTDTPTLVFVHHDNPVELENVVNELFSELVKSGVKVR